MEEENKELSESEMKAILEYLQNQKQNNGGIAGYINATLLMLLIAVVGWQTTRIIDKQDKVIVQLQEGEKIDIHQNGQIARNSERIDRLERER